KPHFEVYERFREKYQRLNQRSGLEQYLVHYLMSSHPGCTLHDAVELAVFLNKTGRQPEQVQDFYPTPGTLSTCMWYTGIDPRTMEPVYVAKSPHDKALQRALLQWKRPEMRRLVVEALHKAGREDLIGYGKECLIRPLASAKTGPSDAKRADGGLHHPRRGSRPEEKRKANEKRSGPAGREDRVRSHGSRPASGPDSRHSARPGKGQFPKGDNRPASRPQKPAGQHSRKPGKR
ncbi:MAG: DUF3362 domain-containing protein, partial [Oscillospiraceae bacterium]|nr:DUF3362 domain-containing protein [Oscillospiraceae bacterium]